MEMLVVGETDIRQAVSMEEAISVVEDGFTSLAAGEVNLPPVLSLEMPEIRGEIHVKGAHVKGAPSSLSSWPLDSTIIISSACPPAAA